MKTTVVLGTRPEIIKLAPIIKLLNKKSTSLIFTGQHYDFDMGLKFIQQLGIRKPDYFLRITRTGPSNQIADIIKKVSVIIKKESPETVIVQGDTNTVLAASISSLKSNIPISHVESGLRSHDWRMPEEHNRIAVDHMSEFLFAPTALSKRNLIDEKTHGKILVTGNTVIDSINQFTKISKKYSELLVNIDDYVLTTFHRSENVDNQTTLNSIVKAIINTNENFIFPLHPRTQKQLKKFGLYEKLKKSGNVLILNSVGYFEMLELMKNCKYIVSDSGGIQEEATAPSIRKKVVVVRKTSDRPESISSGFSVLSGTTYNGIMTSLKKTSQNFSIPNKKSPYGKGDSSKIIVNYLKKNL
ncbi:MAG: UDP-N-acetylglucosamine 2-epimerase (non-hydrolyzing) [Candidatus Nitrosopelagicus sp.]|nr:MAG: UDP-N-acetylglucosamine 2-epimerase (non-hydrolyzing) [Candidatus Nitrosopelagicus sp.]